jgi:hypothetical protein
MNSWCIYYYFYYHVFDFSIISLLRSLGPPTPTGGQVPLSSAQSKLFSVLAPQWWNLLPPEARTAESLSVFRKHLKPYLFKEYLK